MFPSYSLSSGISNFFKKKNTSESAKSPEGAAPTPVSRSSPSKTLELKSSMSREKVDSGPLSPVTERPKSMEKDSPPSKDTENGELNGGISRLI